MTLLIAGWVDWTSFKSSFQPKCVYDPMILNQIVGERSLFDRTCPGIQYLEYPNNNVINQQFVGSKVFSIPSS